MATKVCPGNPGQDAELSGNKAGALVKIAIWNLGISKRSSNGHRADCHAHNVGPPLKLLSQRHGVVHMATLGNMGQEAPDLPWVFDGLYATDFADTAKSSMSTD